jgi:hypothetical protein
LRENRKSWGIFAKNFRENKNARNLFVKIFTKMNKISPKIKLNFAKIHFSFNPIVFTHKQDGRWTTLSQCCPQGPVIIIEAEPSLSNCQQLGTAWKKALKLPP